MYKISRGDELCGEKYACERGKRLKNALLTS